MPRRLAVATCRLLCNLAIFCTYLIIKFVKVFITMSASWKQLTCSLKWWPNQAVWSGLHVWTSLRFIIIIIIIIITSLFSVGLHVHEWESHYFFLISPNVHVFMNMFLICCWQLFIDSPVSPITSILPLVFVITVTAIKQVTYLRQYTCTFVYLSVFNV